MKELYYYIQSQYAPCGNCVSWWAIDGKGYTCDLKKAWLVSEEKARSICSDPSRGEKAWPQSVIDANAVFHFDFQNLREIKSL